MTSQEFTDLRSTNVLNERLARVALKHGLYNLLLQQGTWSRGIGAEDTRRRYRITYRCSFSRHERIFWNDLEGNISKFLRCNMGPVIICADLNSEFKIRGNKRPYRIRAKYIPQGEGGEEWLVECYIDDEVYGKGTYQEPKVASNRATFEAYNTLLAKDGGDSRGLEGVRNKKYEKAIKLEKVNKMDRRILAIARVPSRATRMLRLGIFFYVLEVWRRENSSGVAKST
ncbi:hypothetical protein OSB04_001887 [Centaurea solstitialis]|uniref:Uncharacterized protein n=1 Tax=Centaurea solstitialis TaxID=347529 RepID=A0AA38U4G4_9ASTR|nr:hypothetical protein OSB04_001887 [Centaurea solstitialis]